LEHPLLDAGLFLTEFGRPLGELTEYPGVTDGLTLDAPAPLHSDDEVRAAVRNVLRHGGYKPTGRGKPASEYLLRAAGQEPLRSINLAVDACNVASLHSGLPISVVDLALCKPPLRLALAAESSEYVFNPTGQTIRLDGLLCLHDAEGPCANGVKDSQRTKTRDETTATLSIVWGSRLLEGRTRRTVDWYRELLEGAGATTSAYALA